MPNMTQQELKVKIKNLDFSSVYLFYGEEEFIKKTYCEMLISKCVEKDFEDFNFHKLDGKKLSVDELCECVEALPMMTERTCTLIADFSLDALSETDFNRIIDLLTDFPETAVLIFYVNDTFSKSKNEKHKKFTKIIEGVGSIVSFDKMGEPELEKILVTGASKRNATMSRQTAQYLIRYSGNDLTALQNELDKLCLYVDGGEITTDTIDLISTKSFEATAFDLLKAILAKNADKSFSVISGLLTQGVKQEMILGAVISGFNDMYRVKLCEIAGKNPEYLKEIFSAYKGKDFKLKNASRNCRGLSIENLRKCLDALSECDMNLKGYSFDPQIELEQLVIKLILLIS